jgi:cytochrome c peroxidase
MVIVGLLSGTLADTSTPAAPPRAWGVPPDTVEGPLGEARERLGRYLFYDRRLSGNGCYSCASCHQQERAFTDGRRHAIGATGEEQARNTPSLANVGYNLSLTWSDAHITTLEQQALRPMFEATPPELGLRNGGEDALAAFRADPLYHQLFDQAFPEENDPFSLNSILSALASFERRLISFRSPYDRFVYQGDENALSPAARLGMQLFFSSRLACSECHFGWNLSGSTRSTGEPEQAPVFLNTGVPRDPGENGPREFKVPTLRNVAVTAPYMHNGSLPTLADVIIHYERGGSDDVGKSPRLRGFTLNDTERSDVVEFLTSLTDERFLHESAFADPFIDTVTMPASSQATQRSGCPIR